MNNINFNSFTRADILDGAVVPKLNSADRTRFSIIRLRSATVELEKSKDPAADYVVLSDEWSNRSCNFRSLSSVCTLAINP